MKKIIVYFAVMMFFCIISTRVMSQINNDPNQIEGVLVEIRVYLAGYMSSNVLDIKMRSDHLINGLLPSTPLNIIGGMGYVFPNQAKWLSSKSVKRFFYVSDSILIKNRIVSYGQIELRKGDMSNPQKQYSEYCLVSDSGYVYSLAGTRKVRFRSVVQGDWYLIFHQGNHLSVGSKSRFDASQPISHDFTTGLDKYFSEYLSGRRYENDPAVEVRPGVWAMWGGDCSGAGYLGANGPDNFNDFSDLSFIMNHYSANIYGLGDLNANCKISAEDSSIFQNWGFYGSYIPYIWTTAPSQNRIRPVLNQSVDYRLTASNFIKNLDTVTFYVSLSNQNQDTLLFRWAQLMLKLNYNSATNVDTVILECPINNSQIFLSQGVIQVGMMSAIPIKIAYSESYQIAKVRVVFQKGTCPSVQGLLNWTTSGLRTKIFAQIDSLLVDITNDEFHFIDDSIVVGIHSNSREVKEYMLSQNFPNPFNPYTVINFSIPERNEVSLKVYNSNGREIISLVNEIKESGNYSINFNGSDLVSGVYFYKLTTGNYVETKRMMLIK
jgi:hypothetical protein